MTKRRIPILRLALAVLLLAGAARPAAANCTGPAGTEGQLYYTVTYHLMEFCNGTNWIPMNGGTTVYSAGGTTNPTFTAANGYFVLSAGTWNGNLGGLTGADAKCLSDLTANNWSGKSAAQGFGILNASHVHAWLCDSTNCNNFTGQKKYYYAHSGDASGGGSYFTPDAGGIAFYQGSDTNSGNYGASDNVQWSALSTFNASVQIWGLHGSTYQAASNAPGTNDPNYSCNNWTDDGSGGSGRQGAKGETSAADATKFNSGISACPAQDHLVCLINP